MLALETDCKARQHMVSLQTERNDASKQLYIEENITPSQENKYLDVSRMSLGLL
jgi:hypothetical protein